jgi:hypothetical protein
MCAGGFVVQMDQRKSLIGTGCMAEHLLFKTIRLG